MWPKMEQGSSWRGRVKEQLRWTKMESSLPRLLRLTSQDRTEIEAAKQSRKLRWWRESSVEKQAKMDEGWDAGSCFGQHLGFACSGIDPVNRRHGKAASVGFNTASGIRWIVGKETAAASVK